jgi:predicted nucleotide-binding protein
VVLLTPDDMGGKFASDLKARARQNVVLELGYFWGKLGRSRVCVLYKEGFELPSDLGGLMYVKMDDGGRLALRAREGASLGRR